MKADLALVDANVLTMNPSQPIAQAVAIQKNRIIKVGTTSQINSLIGKDTKVLSLNGKTVLPGLIDTHIHIADFGRCLMWLDFSAADSVQTLQSMLREKAAQTPAGKWIVGRGWNEENFSKKRLLTKVDLDVVAPNNPIILYHAAAYLCVANTLALSEAGVTSQTEPPEGGTIDKTPEGDLTGIFRETATTLIWQKVPEPTPEELTEAAALACQQVVSAGITSVDWIILTQQEVTLIQALHFSSKLPLRVNIILPFEFLNAARNFKSPDPSKMRLGGAIIFVDGYLDSRTAALQEPYSDDPSNAGKIYFTPETLTDSVKQVLAMGLQPVLHAMGDKAIKTALYVIERSPKDVRFRIEQAAVLNPELIQRLRTQNIVISVQPRMVPTEFNVWKAAEHLGTKRAKWLHPLKTLIGEGVRVAGGSDCPMEPLNPLLGIQDAVTRESYPEQRLTVEEALRMYALDAAYCSGEENLKGSIAEGKLADLTVLASDPTVFEEGKNRNIAVTMTIIDGKILPS